MNITHCEVCGLFRWIRDNNYDKTPRKQFHYFPLGPRLQRKYASTSHIRRHVEHHSEEEELCQPLDSEAWLTFNAMHLDFSREIRNVRLGLCIDGFNPFGSWGKNIHVGP